MIDSVSLCAFLSRYVFATLAVCLGMVDLNLINFDEF